ncbi:MAG: SCO family protein [Ignavibacteriales bacterium]|nr:SCO family protein [Ignavibacteriales bacterium]
MKKALIISATVSVVLLGVVLYLLIGVKNVESAPLKEVKQSSSEVKSCCANLKNDKANDNSIYQLESVWKTESGNKITLNNLKGKKQIMAMIFANCTYACPLIVNDMKKIESKIKQNDVDFLLVSIDSKRDTPEALTQYAKNNKLDMKRWHLLTGDENGISELAAVLGFKYKKEPDGSFSHSNIINVLDENGVVTYQHFGLNQDVQDVIEEINKNKEQ